MMIKNRIVVLQGLAIRSQKYIPYNTHSGFLIASFVSQNAGFLLSKTFIGTLKYHNNARETQE